MHDANRTQLLIYVMYIVYILYNRIVSLDTINGYNIGVYHQLLSVLLRNDIFIYDNDNNKILIVSDMNKFIQLMAIIIIILEH